MDVITDHSNHVVTKSSIIIKVHEELMANNQTRLFDQRSDQAKGTTEVFRDRAILSALAFSLK